jgi:hypothetical protein
MGLIRKLLYTAFITKGDVAEAIKIDELKKLNEGKKK